MLYHQKKTELIQGPPSFLHAFLGTDLVNSHSNEALRAIYKRLHYTTVKPWQWDMTTSRYDSSTGVFTYLAQVDM